MWIRFSGIREVRTVLMDVLNTEQKRLIYTLSDGEVGSIDIGKYVGVSHSTITRYWDSWKRLGIVEAVPVRGGLRYKKVFELEDFGFSIPVVKAENRSEKRHE